MLERAELLKLVKTADKQVRAIKGSKILFQNSNWYYAIANELWIHSMDRGTIRESFFVSQISGKVNVFTSKKVDFLVRDSSGRDYEIEVGGSSKNKKQIEDLENGYVFKEGIEIGFDRTIPLYLTGFLY